MGLLDIFMAVEHPVSRTMVVVEKLQVTQLPVRMSKPSPEDFLGRTKRLMKLMNKLPSAANK